MEDIRARMKEEMAERKKRKLERRAQGEIDERMVDDDDFDLNLKVVDFSQVDHGMGNKRFTSRFSFIAKDSMGKLDKRWDAGDANDGGDFWKTEGPSAAELAKAEKDAKREAKKEERRKVKEEARANEEAREEQVAHQEDDKKKKKKVALAVTNQHCALPQSYVLRHYVAYSAAMGSGSSCVPGKEG